MLTYAANTKNSCAGTKSPLSIHRHTDKRAYWKTIFLISRPKHMLWILKRTAQ